MAGPTTQAVVSLSGVTRRYDQGAGYVAVDDVSLQVAPDSFVFIMGPSGSGKSTLLNLIAGLDRPTKGDVVVDGVALDRLSEAGLSRFRRRHVGLVFQFFNLINNLSALDNVVLPARLSGDRRAVAYARGRDLLARLELGDKVNAYPATMSGGERQRVAIARALINQPAVLLADEPTGALDSRNGDLVVELLSQLNKDGQTIVMVTHDERLAGQHADHIVRLRDGRVVDEVRTGAAGVVGG
jgi:putative ABC transport system ATP-binding protein